MGNGTFLALETEEIWDEALEKYRFAFIRYLEVVADYLELMKASEGVSEIEYIWSGKWSTAERDELRRRNTTKTEEFLFRRYGLENTPEGLERAIRQFRADLSDVSKKEKSLWHDLVQAIDVINVEHDCSSERPIWYQDDSDYQHHLLLGIDDDLTVKRIIFYKRCLNLFGEKPDFPAALEVTFNLQHGEFASSVLFPA